MDIKQALSAAKHAALNGYRSYYMRALVVLADALTAATKWEVVKGRVYIAGPMTGYSNLNFPAFHAAAKSLRAQGYEVINPAEVNPDPGMKWSDAMRGDIRELMTCDSIYLLDGWRDSRGAGIEYYLANAIGLTIMEQAIGIPRRAPVAVGADSSTLGGAGV